jgi:hypothetical protein
MTRTYCDCKDAINSNATRQKLRAPRNLTIVVIDNGLKSLSRPTATATALVIMTVAHSGSLTNSNWAPTSQFRYACGSGFTAGGTLAYCAPYRCPTRVIQTVRDRSWMGDQFMRGVGANVLSVRMGD